MPVRNGFGFENIIEENYLPKNELLRNTLLNDQRIYDEKFRKLVERFSNGELSTIHAEFQARMELGPSPQEIFNEFSKELINMEGTTLESTVTRRMPFMEAGPDE